MSIYILRFPYEFGDKAFLKLSDKWRRLPNVDIRLPDEVCSGSTDAIANLVERVSRVLPDELGFAVLNHIADLELLSGDTLRRLFEIGDLGVRISIALRSDIPSDLLQICLESDEEDILEHVIFNPRVSVDQCKAIIARPASESLLMAIERAIGHKVGN